MARIDKTDGLKAILQNFDAFEKGANAAIKAGLIKAGLFLQRKSQEVVPVDTGALRASAFTRVVQGSRSQLGQFTTAVAVGYTMFYAIWVHENLEAGHAPGKIAKYLEVPAKRFKRQMLRIVRDEVEASLKDVSSKRKR